MYQPIKLKDDYLDRGEYAMTLLKIIADYAPKTPYEIMDGDDEDIGEINEGEIKFVDYDLSKDEFKDHMFRTEARNFEPAPQQTSQAEGEPAYTIKLNHLDNEAFIMAISGSWGSGKTKFMEMFFNLLHGKGYQANGNEQDAAFIKNNRFEKGKVAYFDAWENDFYDDPIIPFAQVVLDTVCVDQSQYRKAAENVWKTYQRMLHAKDKGLRIIKDNDKLSDKIDGVKKLLRDSIEHKKIVIIVDELDRCKPTFAIKLLEIVKHLFNVKGIVFIFALDINQLQHCVKTVYGDAFDAIGYLERFFDYYSLLPRGSDEHLFRMFAEEYGILEDVGSFYEMCGNFDLTPREMKGICSSFYYLNKYQLKGYPLKARQLCFYLLLLKHRYPERIHSLLAKGMKGEREKFFSDKIPDCLKASNTEKDPFLAALVENARIKDMKLAHISNDGKSMGEERYDFSRPLEDEGSLSYIIYAQDYKKDIGDRHVLEYLFDKVETYGDAIPMETKGDKIKRGMRLTFGRWHRETEEDMEPIEWIVLERRGDMALLVTKYAIDCLPYNREYVDTTWEECDLRKWLNGEFYQKAFNKDEKLLIALAEVAAEKNPLHDTNPGIDTNDKLFLLSMQEAGKYFENDQKRVCKPTEHARKKLIEGYRGFLEGLDPKERKKLISLDEFIERVESSCEWWLRSPGNYGLSAADVDYDGSVYAFSRNVNDDFVAVRLALWLILNP